VVSIKSAGARYAELVFLHLMGSTHVVNCGASRSRNIYTLFFVLGCVRYEIDKKCFRTHDAELVFLHPLGSMGHVLHSGVSGCEASGHYFSRSGGPGAVSIKSASGHLTLNLCFCIHWDLWVTLCIPACPTRQMSTHYFRARVGPVRFLQKARRVT
jgi:hypothetical protein